MTIRGGDGADELKSMQAKIEQLEIALQTNPDQAVDVGSVMKELNLANVGTRLGDVLTSQSAIDDIESRLAQLEEHIDSLSGMLEEDVGDAKPDSRAAARK